LRNEITILEFLSAICLFLILCALSFFLISLSFALRMRARFSSDLRSIPLAELQKTTSRFEVRLVTEERNAEETAKDGSASPPLSIKLPFSFFNSLFGSLESAELGPFGQLDR